jgi:hypothetical protein
MDCTARSSTTRNALLHTRPAPAALLGFFEAGFSKRPPRGLVDQEAQFVAATHIGHAGRALPSSPDQPEHRSDTRPNLTSDAAYARSIGRAVSAFLSDSVLEGCDAEEAIQGQGSLQVDRAKESIEELKSPESRHTAAFFKKYDAKIAALKTTIDDAKKIEQYIVTLRANFKTLHDELDATKDGLKEEFAETERKLVKALAEQGVTSIQPDAYVKLTRQKADLTSNIADLKKKTAKR